MMDFMGPVSMMQGGAGAAPIGPAVTINSASMSGGSVLGYIRYGGISAGLFGESGGTLSGTLLAGYTTDAVFEEPGSGIIGVIFVGNCVSALLALTALSVDGVSCAVSVSPEYTGGDSNFTNVSFTSTASLVVGTNQTIQLV